MFSADLRRRHRKATGLLAAAVIGCGICATSPLPVQASTAPSAAVAGPCAGSRADEKRDNVSPYGGLGTWVDIYDSKQWAHPGKTVRRMRAEEVRTVFIETANYGAPRTIFHPGALGRFIDAAHRRGIRVVGWYLPSFAHLRRDLCRSLAVIGFRTDTGQRFDGFGLDIEADVVSPVSTRIRRMLRLSHKIRAAVGSSYSLGAIIPSPYGMNQARWYWGRVRDFPYLELARVYDVIAPMSYFTYRTSGMRQAHRYTGFNIRVIRHLSGSTDIPLHPIGGVATQASRNEVRGYVRALRERAVLGGSLYDFATTTRRQWPVLRRIPVNGL